jgi:hypothetical protein
MNYDDQDTSRDTSHEAWMNERQGPANTRHRSIDFSLYRREKYQLRASWEGGEAVGTTFSEADREQVRNWQIETELIRDQGIENLCSKD